MSDTDWLASSLPSCANVCFLWIFYFQETDSGIVSLIGRLGQPKEKGGSFVRYVNFFGGLGAGSIEANYRLAFLEQITKTMLCV